MSVAKLAVHPHDQLVFCPLRYRDVHVERCLDCSRLIRIDDEDPPHYIVCDLAIESYTHRATGT